MMKQTEHRSAARKPFNLPAEYCYPAGNWVGSAGEAVSLNMSEHGALIRAKGSLRIEKDDIISISLGLDPGKVTLEGRVARVDPHDDGTCDYGIVFRNISADDQYLLMRQMAKQAP